MRAAIIVVVFVVASLGLSALVPTAPAVGICSELKDRFCDGYLLCVGYQRDSRGFSCTGTGIERPCDPCPLP